ncbi:hypothetical protein IWQ61_006270 [Dispira simplex]|nr:hypothetical protein IWQ61_006270 [Dispira simplex]
MEGLCNKKNVPRVKGNARPASSSRAADLADLASVSLFRANPSLAFNQLLNQGVNGGGQGVYHSADSSGTGSNYSTRPSTPDSFHNSTAHSGDGTMDLLLKKLNKRDPQTRIRALEEAKALVEDRSVNNLQLLTHAWPRLYHRGTVTSERRLRLLTNQVNTILVTKLGRHIQPILAMLLPPWLLTFFDPIADIAQEARTGYEQLFKPEKRVKALVKCRESIMAYITKNICQHTAESLIDPQLVDVEERRRIYEHVVSGSFRALSHLVQTIPPDEWPTPRQDLDTLLDDSHFWEKCYHSAPTIRRAAYGVLSALTSYYPDVLDSRLSYLGHAFIRKAVMDKDPATHQELWEALTLVTKHFPGAWVHAGEKKPILPKVYEMISQGGFGSPRYLAAGIQAVLHYWPRELLGEDLLTTGTDLLHAFARGVPHVVKRSTDWDEFFQAWVRVVLYFVHQLVQRDDQLQATSLVVSQATSLGTLGLVQYPSDATINELATLVYTLKMEKFPRNLAELVYNRIHSDVQEYLIASEDRTLSELYTALGNLLRWVKALQGRHTDIAFTEQIPHQLGKLGLTFMEQWSRQPVSAGYRRNLLLLLKVLVEQQTTNFLTRPEVAAQLDEFLLTRLQEIKKAAIDSTVSDPYFDLLGTTVACRAQLAKVHHVPVRAVSQDLSSASSGEESTGAEPALSRLSLQSAPSIPSPHEDTQDNGIQLLRMVLSTLLEGSNKQRQLLLLDQLFESLTGQPHLINGGITLGLHTALQEFIQDLKDGPLGGFEPVELSAAFRVQIRCLILSPSIIPTSLAATVYEHLLLVVGQFYHQVCRGRQALPSSANQPCTNDIFLVDAFFTELAPYLKVESLYQYLLSPESPTLVLWLLDLAALERSIPGSLGDLRSDTSEANLDIYQQVYQPILQAQRCREGLLTICKAGSAELQERLRTATLRHLRYNLWDPEFNMHPLDLKNHIYKLISELCPDLSERQRALHSVLHNPGAWSTILQYSFHCYPDASLEIIPEAAMDSYLSSRAVLVQPEHLDILQNPPALDTSLYHVLWSRVMVVTCELASDKNVGVPGLFFTEVANSDDPSTHPMTLYQLLPERSWLIHCWVLGWLVSQDEEINLEADHPSFPLLDSTRPPWSHRLRVHILQFLRLLLFQCTVSEMNSDAADSAPLGDLTKLSPNTLFEFISFGQNSSPVQRLTPTSELSHISYRMVRAFHDGFSPYHLRALMAFWRFIAADMLELDHYAVDSTPPLTTVRVTFNDQLNTDEQHVILQRWFNHLADQYEQRLDPYIYLALLKSFGTLEANHTGVKQLRRRCLEALAMLAEQPLLVTLDNPNMFTNLCTGLAASTHLFFIPARRVTFELPQVLRSKWASHPDIQKDIALAYDSFVGIQQQVAELLPSLVQEYHDATDKPAEQDAIQFRVVQLLVVISQLVRFAYPVVRCTAADTVEFLAYFSSTVSLWIYPWASDVELDANAHGSLINGVIQVTWANSVYLTGLIMGRYEHNLGFSKNHKLTLPEPTQKLLSKLWTFYAHQTVGTAGEDTKVKLSLLNSLAAVIVTVYRMQVMRPPSPSDCIDQLRKVNRGLLTRTLVLCQESMVYFSPDEFTPVVLQDMALLGPMAFSMSDDPAFEVEVIPEMDTSAVILRTLLLYRLFLDTVERRLTDLGESQSDTGLKRSRSNMVTPEQQDQVGYILSLLCRLVGVSRFVQRKPFNVALWDPTEYDYRGLDLYQGLSYALLAVNLWYNSLWLLPTVVRRWWESCRNRQLIQEIERFTTRYFSPSIIAQELQLVDKHTGIQDLVNKHSSLSVRTFSNSGSCSIRFEIDDTTIDLVLRMPASYPLQLAQVECVDASIVGDDRWQAWRRNAHALAQQSDHRFADLIYHFTRNIAYRFDGVEECYICYSVVCVKSRMLPTRPCPVCKHKFHHTCLETWFTKSAQTPFLVGEPPRTCPLCRSTFP